MKLPIGMSYVGNFLVDNCPAQALRDARRTLSRIPADPAMLDETAAEVAAEAERDMIRLGSRPQAEERDTTPMIVSRLATDRARLIVIQVLGRLHRGPKEPTPQEEFPADAPARSRLFKEIVIYSVRPIDAVAVRVAGSDPD